MPLPTAWLLAFRPARRVLAVLGVVAAAALLTPVALGTLTGSGQLNDIVAETTSVGTISGSSLTTSDGTPVASGTAFTVTNSNSNVDTLIRYDWSTTPYYGSSSSQTSIALRGTTYQIADLLLFKQQAITGAGTTTTSEYFSPLALKSAATSSLESWSSAGNACTAWTGTAAVGFIKTAAGSFTFKYQTSGSAVDDAPTTSDTFYYCLDTTNSQVYLGKSTAFGSATLVSMYTTDSALATLKTYQYELLSGSQANGNKYCFLSVQGSGTSATPDLVQCSKLAWSASGAATAKMYPMFDPPAYFPSGNQAGASSVVTFAIAGTQWNPFAHTTTNSA
jgi:hypothetical protein